MGVPYRPIQSNFTAGELSPRLRGRVDFQKYYNGLAECTNLIPFVHGGVTRRTGTVFAAEVKTSSLFTRLIPFKFSTTQNYVLEFGNTYMRVYRARGQVISGTAYEIATPYATADLRELKFTQSADTLYIFHKSYAPRKITRTADASWSIAEIDFVDGAYLAVNSTATTINQSGATGTGVTLTASTSIFAATDVGRLVRMKVGSNAWGYAKITAYTSGTVVTADIKSTLTATGATTVWRLGAWSGTTGYPSVGTFFQERLYMGSTTSEPQTVWGSSVGDFENHAPSEGDGTVIDSNAVNFTISDDQVNAICWMNAGKVLNIGTRDAEFSLYGGQAGSSQAVTPTNITITRETTHGSTPNVRVRRIGNSVAFVQPSKRRLRELSYNFRVDSYEAKDLTLLSEHITTSGIVDFDYQEEIDPKAWFVREDGVLVGLTYDKLEEVVAWHKHIIGGTDAVVESIAVIPAPNEVKDDLWMVVRRTINGTTKRYVEYISDDYDPDTNGQASGIFVDSAITYDGYLDATLTPAATTGTGIDFTAGSAVFTSGMVGDVIKSGTARATITGFTSSTVVVCTINRAFSSTSAIASGSWSVATDNFTGADHLDGETVQVCADGASHPDIAISSGSGTLDNKYSKVHIGFNSPAKLLTLPPEVQLNASATGRIKRLREVTIYFYQSIMCKFGRSFTELEVIPARKAGDPMDAPPPLRSGIENLLFSSGYSLEPQVAIQQDLPLPLSVLYISYDMEVYE